jgi:OmpA-OmpF porin, OOP family
MKHTTFTAWFFGYALLAFLGMNAIAQSQNDVPAMKLMPGTPSDPNPRVEEPKHYNDLQARITLFKPQNCQEEYHRSKAQAWLNFSRDQYHENAWQMRIQTTTAQEAERIILALEGRKPLSMDTPHVSGSQRLRPDLWALANKAKVEIAKTTDRGCCPANVETAFCEVQLVWAGHALANLGGWKRANGHVRMAEDLCQQSQVNACQTMHLAAPVMTASQPISPVLAEIAHAEPKLQAITTIETLRVEILFFHNRFTKEHILPESKALLLAFSHKAKQMKVKTVSLIGFADMTNSSTDTDYNTRLSQARVETVHKVLMGLDVDLSQAHVQAQADRHPVKLDCTVPRQSDGARKGQAKQQELAGYYACLQPNRRVEVVMTGLPR